jgi:hypothetical protein
MEAHRVVRRWGSHIFDLNSKVKTPYKYFFTIRFNIIPSTLCGSQMRRSAWPSLTYWIVQKEIVSLRRNVTPCGLFMAAYLVRSQLLSASRRNSRYGTCTSDFETTDWLHFPANLPYSKEPSASIEGGWVLRAVWTLWQTKKYAPTANRTPVSQPATTPSLTTFTRDFAYLNGRDIRLL